MDETPGFGRMVAVVGAMSVLGLIAPGGVQAEPRTRRLIPMYWPLRTCSTMRPRRRNAMAATSWGFRLSE
ncbi:MAG: hypothetical protein QOJ24_550 [Mycobacterium sp.]|nr:hypothetical protein [Mycobacterium sp.]